MRPQLVPATLLACCLAIGLAGACGGGEFAPGDQESPAGSGGAQAGTTNQGKSGSGGHSSKAGAAGATSSGGKAGAFAGGAGAGGVGGATAGASGHGGGGAGGVSMGGAGMGGGPPLGPCAGKTDVDCLNCCNQVAPLSSYEERSYECACSEPCYALCEGNCNTLAPRSLACHRCVAQGLGANPTNLCKPNVNACDKDPSCLAVTTCLRSCL